MSGYGSHAVPGGANASSSVVARLGMVRKLWASDLYRYSGDIGWRAFVHAYFATPGFRYCVFMRLFAAFTDGGPLTQGRSDPLSWLARRLAIVWLRRYEFRYGINISFDTDIGPGLYIGHHGAITVHDRARIGKNCNLSQEVTIGEVQSGPKVGVPTIGDNVYVGPGAKVIGNVRVGDDVVVGANCVVVNDVADGAVVVGVPGRVLHYTGSEEFVRYRVP